MNCEQTCSQRINIGSRTFICVEISHADCCFTVINDERMLASRHITSFYIRNQRAKHKRMLRDSTDWKFAISTFRFFCCWSGLRIRCHSLCCSLCAMHDDKWRVCGSPKEWLKWLFRSPNNNYNDPQHQRWKTERKKSVRGCRENVNVTWYLFTFSCVFHATRNCLF